MNDCTTESQRDISNPESASTTHPSTIASMSMRQPFLHTFGPWKIAEHLTPSGGRLQQKLRNSNVVPPDVTSASQRKCLLPALIILDCWILAQNYWTNVDTEINDRISNPKFLEQCKIWNKVLYCIRLSSVVLRYILIFALLNRERVFLEMTGLATPNFLTNAKFEIKYCIVFVFLPSSFVHKASELSLNYKFLLFPFPFTRLKLYH